MLDDRSDARARCLEEFEIKENDSSDNEQVADRREPFYPRWKRDREDGRSVASKGHRIVDDNHIEDDENDREQGELKNEFHFRKAVRDRKGEDLRISHST